VDQRDHAVKPRIFNHVGNLQACLEFLRHEDMQAQQQHGVAAQVEKVTLPGYLRSVDTEQFHPFGS
jgi:hypothetical protein